jgi:hypothetical protein
VDETWSRFRCVRELASGHPRLLFNRPLQRAAKPRGKNMKMLTAATIASLTMVACPFVLAQSQPSPPTTPPAATAPSSTQLSWYSHQAGEMRASKLIGTVVKNQADETIGDINEVVLSKDGKVAAVVIGVGGFLGLGEREVAVPFDSLKLSQDQNQNTVLTLNATKESLKAAPQWEWSSGRRGTTGTSGTKPSK